MKKTKLFATFNHNKKVDITVLLLRLVVGAAFMFHGFGKIQNPFEWAVGSPIPGIFQALAALAEFGGGLALIIGFLMPLASFGLVCTMVVAVCMHAFVLGDPFVNTKGGGSYELALVYLTISLLFLSTGPGKFSLDHKVFGIK